MKFLREGLAHHLRKWSTLFLLLALGSQGCSAATAMGCVVGAASGASFVLGMSGVAASDENAPEIDVGAAALGGALIGLVSGCAASAASNAFAVAESQNRSEREPDPPRGSMPEHSPYYVTKPAAGPISNAVVVNGIKVSWHGDPTKDRDTIEMHFYGYRPRAQAQLASCHEARLVLDGQESRYLLQRPVDEKASRKIEGFQLQANQDVFATMAAAGVVVVDLCGKRLLLSQSARQGLTRFNTRFRHLAGEVTARNEERSVGTEEPSKALPALNIAEKPATPTQDVTQEEAAAN